MEAATANHFAIELEFVAEQLRAGRFGEEEIRTLRNVIVRMRGDVQVSGTEAEVVARFNAAKTEEELAAADIGSFFWPLIKAATTEKEARALMARMPGDAVLKAFAMDHFVFVSKVIPRVSDQVAVGRVS